MKITIDVVTNLNMTKVICSTLFLVGCGPNNECPRGMSPTVKTDDGVTYYKCDSTGKFGETKKRYIDFRCNLPGYKLTFSSYPDVFKCSNSLGDIFIDGTASRLFCDMERENLWIKIEKKNGLRLAFVRCSNNDKPFGFSSDEELMTKVFGNLEPSPDPFVTCDPTQESNLSVDRASFSCGE